MTESHRLTVSLFNFPSEKRHRIKAKDLIYILKYCRRAVPAPQNKTRAQCCAAALDEFTFDPERKRRIFSQWPRSPDGVALTPDNSLPGKTAPNGTELWGETMFDFYMTRRLYDLRSPSTITTGSKMHAFAKAHNELDAAKEEIEFAETENEPQRLTPYSLKTRLDIQEANIRLGRSGASSSSQSDRQMDDSPTRMNPPMLPFSYQAEPLQDKIPLHRLPKKITVHDPWNLLAVRSENIFGRAEQPEKSDWSTKPDRTHTYVLELTSAGMERVEKELAEISKPRPTSTSDFESDPASRDSTGYYLDYPAVEGPMAPAVWIVPPPRPTSEAPVDNANGHEDSCGHLYISPSHHLGEGNHSVVYTAEWELPRSVLFGEEETEFIYCYECGKEDARRILEETDGKFDEAKDPQWTTKSASWKRTVLRKPQYSMDLVSPHGGETISVVTRPEEVEVQVEYRGPLRIIRTAVGWQNYYSPTCSHLEPVPVPEPLARVRVVAKMSMNGDRHLVREAGNYQEFEDHMFEHWTGLSLVWPYHDPVPLGPIVPQFYGYYVPEDGGKRPEGYAARRYHPADSGDKAKWTEERKGYFSPILLQEYCGSQIQPKDLTEDESHEVASLFYRFHRAGWVHNSVFERNVLYQYGPLDLPYSQHHTARSERRLSFRLIDFGRSARNDDGAGLSEDQVVDRLFRRRDYSKDGVFPSGRLPGRR